MNTLSATFLSLMLLVFPFFQQGGIVLVPNDNHPMPTLVEYDTVLWLENNRPADTHLYVVMSYAFNRNGEFISLAGLDPSTPPPYAWQLEDGNVIWTGTVKRSGGQIENFRPYGETGGITKLARLVEAGGSTSLYLPWQAGQKMMFGERGVHGGGFGISGAIGIDWVGGDRFDGSASNVVYASTSGTVTDTCTDDTSAAVLIESSGGEKVGYFHLELNTHVEQGDLITRGQPIGTLRYGNFDDTCGWAAQQSYNYHLHWVIVPAEGYYRAEGWVLNVGGVYWERGNERINKRQWLAGGGGTGGAPPGEDDGEPPPVVIIVPGDPGGSGGGGSKLFDFVVLAINEIYSYFRQYLTVDAELLTMQEDSYVMAGNVMRTMIQDWNLLLVNDVITITPWYWFIMIVFTGEIVRSVIILVIMALVSLKKMPGVV
jgi:hypothetical protein